MDSKKRMMFILEEDYYFITIKILSILKSLNCSDKPFEDYRKLGIVFEFIKSQINLDFLYKLLNSDEKDIFDTERIIKIFCDSRLDVSIIKRILFFLEKRKIVELSRSIKNSNIDVRLLENEELEALVESGALNDDLKSCMEVKKLIPRLKNLKLETLQKKVFGYDEVAKWEE